MDRLYRRPRALKVDLARQLREAATPAERAVWELVRNRQMLGFKFRRQHPIGGFLVDFYCHELRLVLEIDGAVHAEPGRADLDRARSEWLAARGFRILRLANGEVNRANLLTMLGNLLNQTPSPRSGEGGGG
ncbi:MAG: endonuclease domain-containing protein [Gemmatimonadales bacterium]